MELKELIERAEKAAGGQKALALRISQDAGNIRGAKAGIKGLPDYACVMIAELIGENAITVIAASNLVTEKKEERRKVWHPFVKHAASILMTIIVASVTTVVTPSPAKAAPMLHVVDSTLYIMSNDIRTLSALLRSTENAQETIIYLPFRPVRRHPRTA